MSWFDWVKLLLPYVVELGTAVYNALKSSHSTAVSQLKAKGLIK